MCAQIHIAVIDVSMIVAFSAYPLSRAVGLLLTVLLSLFHAAVVWDWMFDRATRGSATRLFDDIDSLHFDSFHLDPDEF